MLLVSPGGAMKIEFETIDGSLGRGLGVTGTVPPRVRIAAASGSDPDWVVPRVVELLRRTGGTNSALRWQPQAVE